MKPHKPGSSARVSPNGLEWNFLLLEGKLIVKINLASTRLLSEPGRGFVEFSQSRYCAVVSEATPISGDVITVSAIHSKNGPILRYSILEGNEEGLFKIDEVTGVISLADTLDFERRDKHELVVSAETAEGVTGSAQVRVVVEDANDSPPVFLRSNPVVTVIEDDDRHLPAVIAQVTAVDLDALDKDGLIYGVAGDGIDGYPPDEVFFTINKDTGDLIQLKALDRDPPHGKSVWKLRVEVADGQAPKKHPEKNNGVLDTEQGSETSTQTHWKHFTKEDFVSSSTGSDVLDEDNAILGERLTGERNERGPRRPGEGLMRGAASSNVWGWKTTGRRRNGSPDKENEEEEEEEEQGRPSLEAAKENTIWDHRQKRHSDSQVTKSDKTFVSKLNKGGNVDRSPDTGPWEVTEGFTDKTNRRLFIKKSYWKEVKGDPDTRKNSLYPSSYQIWQNIAGDRHRKKQVDTRDAQRQFWVSPDNRRYSERYQAQDDLCSRSGHKRKCRYRYKKDRGAWIRHNGSENENIFSWNIKEGKELNEENTNGRITRVRRKANARRRRESSLEHDWTDKARITNRQKWGKYKRVPLAREQTQGKSLPEGKFGLENYILTGGVQRGVSDKEPRHLQGSRLKRMRSRETQKALGKNQVKSLRHFTGNSLEASVNEGKDDGDLGDVDEGSGRELEMNTLTHGKGRDEEPTAFLGVKSDKLHSEAGGKNYSLKARIINRRLENARKRKESRKRRNISYHMTRRGDGGNSRSRPKTSSIAQRPRSHFRNERSNVRVSFKEREDKMNEQKKRKRERTGFYLDHKTKISTKKNEDSRKWVSGNRTLFWQGGEMLERMIKPNFQGELNIEGRTNDENSLDVPVQTFQKTQAAQKLHNVRHNDVKRVSKRRAMLKRGYGENKIPAKSLGITELHHINNYGFPLIPHDGDGDRERKTKGDGSNFHLFPIMGHTGFNLNQKIVQKGNKNIHLSRQRMDDDKDKSLDRLSEKPTDVDIHEDTIKLNQTLTTLACVNEQHKYADICSHSNVQFTQSGIETLRRDPNLQQTILSESDNIQNASRTNVPFHAPSTKSNEKRERINKQHEFHSEEPEQRLSRETKGSLKNLKSVVFVDSKEMNHLYSFNASTDATLPLPKTKKDQGTYEGLTNSSQKIRKQRRRELHQNGDEGCTTAKTDNSGNGGGIVHKVTTTVTIIVKDINDNAPVFPESVITGEVEENGQLGLPVARISAWDADDRTEGLNGRITYSIEKNVIDEDTGRAIFNVDPKTGVIRTALCCLDRETTPEYQIQVVATDGGGLKGTGTVVIRIGDENDNSPEFPSERFELEVDETWGNGDPDPVTPLMEVTCFDPDVRNDFLYRIMERSGWGWDYFDVRSEGRIGQLYARRPLDYENPSHRRELAFKLQVTDRGEEGWLDPTHVDTAWVIVQIKDVNDNAPVFETTHAQISVREDVPQGTILATFRAHDPDMGGKGVVDYKIVDHSDFLEVDDEGVVRIKTESFDREALEEDDPVIRIVAVDRGQPPLTSTASLSLSVMDMNDSPPYILPPTVFHVREGVPPAKLGLLKAYDEDSWALGNGPPFNISLAPTNRDYIYEFVELKFDKKLDSGRGAATLWTRKPMDREKHHQLDVRVTLTDARGLTNEQTVTVVVDDVNDNPMKPGKKTIYLYKIQGRGGSVNVPLGRVYVDDPDDWDLKDKTFKWATSAHPLFTLDQQEGTIYASSQVREGRYLLQFSVSDRVSRQRGVSANVTVIAKTLEHKTLVNAAPITVFPATPDKITKDWNPVEGGGVLGHLTDYILSMVGKEEHILEVVSVYGNSDGDHKDGIRQKSEASRFSSVIIRHQQNGHDSLASSSSSSSLSDGTAHSVPAVSVWITVRNKTGDFMNPVKLKGLLSLHKRQLETSAGINVTVEGMDGMYLGLKDKDHHHDHRMIKLEATKYREKNPAKPQGDNPFEDTDRDAEDWESDDNGDVGREREAFENKDFYTTRYKADASGGPSPMASVSSSIIHLQVIDTNNTSLVTPRLKQFYDCKSPSMSQPRQEQACSPGSCLNGGRCVQFSDGKRCICPGGSVGYNCKVLSRSFMGSGWSWLPSIPPCFPSTMSLKILTQQRRHFSSIQGLLKLQGTNFHSWPFRCQMAFLNY
ncbi:uncharacterized protein [Macrobrachium rosenbergii]|uniref:uncharacterized protein n=1 Tax=Macrobrachium rosenbergii TaxID=79674 RepID=UPI0034D3EF43